MPPDRREKNYQFETFFLADKGSRGTSSKLDLPAHFHVRPVDTSVQGGKYDKKKIPSTSTTPVNGDKKKPCRKYIPLFGVLLNIYPRCKRSPRFDVCAYVCLIVSGNRECSGVAQLPRLTFHILNLPHFKSFACILRSITTIWPPFKLAKSMKTFNIYLMKSVANFKIFLLAGGALAGAWGAYIA